MNRRMWMRPSRVALAVLGAPGSLVPLRWGGGGGGGPRGAGTPQLVRLTTPSIPAATTGVFYSVQFTADVPPPPALWLVNSGILPTGLKFDLLTGQLSG